MDVVIKGHPVDRMGERGFTEADVRYVIKNYTFGTPSKKGGATVLFGNPRGDKRVLKVVLLGDPPRTDPYIVKTAAWRDEA